MKHLAVLLLLVPVFMTPASALDELKVSDPAQLVGKKVKVLRAILCVPGTFTPNLNYAGKQATVVSVKPGRGMSIPASSLNRMSPQAREMLEDQSKAATLLLEFEDGTRLDTCAAIGPKKIAENFEPASAETHSPAAQPASSAAASGSSVAPSATGATAPAAALQSAAVSTPAVAPQKVPEPFGFHYGASKAEITRQLGSDAVTKVSNEGVTLSVKTAPSPHPAFESYVLFFSPTKGLLKVIAVGKTVETADDGTELRREFDKLKGSLESKYGSSRGLDNCKEEGPACEPRFFMMELKEKNRNLFAIWETNNTDITLDAVAAGINKGYVTLSYEFPGWGEFVDSLNKKKDSVL